MLVKWALGDHRAAIVTEHPCCVFHGQHVVSWGCWSPGNQSNRHRLPCTCILRYMHYILTWHWGPWTIYAHSYLKCQLNSWHSIASVGNRCYLQGCICHIAWWSWLMLNGNSKFWYSLLFTHCICHIVLWSWLILRCKTHFWNGCFTGWDLWYVRIS